MASLSSLDAHWPMPVEKKKKLVYLLHLIGRFVMTSKEVFRPHFQSGNCCRVCRQAKANLSRQRSVKLKPGSKVAVVRLSGCESSGKSVCPNRVRDTSCKQAWSAFISHVVVHVSQITTVRKGYECSQVINNPRATLSQVFRRCNLRIFGCPCCNEYLNDLIF